MKIRAAEDREKEEILRIIEALDLSYPDQSLKNFWVAEKEGKIVGIANLEEHEEFMFLSSVGVLQEHQRQGIASHFLEEILKNARKKVYLYTQIPGFFEKIGFRVTTPRSNLPARRTFHCRECTPETCVCLVRQP